MWAHVTILKSREVRPPSVSLDFMTFLTLNLALARNLLFGNGYNRHSLIFFSQLLLIKNRLQVLPHLFKNEII